MIFGEVLGSWYRVISAGLSFEESFDSGRSSFLLHNFFSNIPRRIQSIGDNIPAGLTESWGILLH